MKKIMVFISFMLMFICVPFSGMKVKAVDFPKIVQDKIDGGWANYIVIFQAQKSKNIYALGFEHEPYVVEGSRKYVFYYRGDTTGYASEFYIYNGQYKACSPSYTSYQDGTIPMCSKDGCPIVYTNFSLKDKEGVEFHKSDEEPPKPKNNNTFGTYVCKDGSELKYNVKFYQDNKTIECPSGMWKWSNGSDFDMEIELEKEGLNGTFIAELLNQDGYVHKNSVFNIFDKKDYPSIQEIGKNKSIIRFTNIPNTSDFLHYRMYTFDHDTIKLPCGIGADGTWTETGEFHLYFWNKDTPVLEDTDKKPKELPIDYEPPTDEDNNYTDITNDDIMRQYDDKSIQHYKKGFVVDGIYSLLDNTDTLEVISNSANSIRFNGEISPNTKLEVYHNNKLLNRGNGSLGTYVQDGENIIVTNLDGGLDDVLVKVVDGLFKFDYSRTDGVLIVADKNNPDYTDTDIDLKPIPPVDLEDTNKILVNIQLILDNIKTIVLFPFRLLLDALTVFKELFMSIAEFTRAMPFVKSLFGWLPIEVQNIMSGVFLSGLIMALYRIIRR